MRSIKHAIGGLAALCLLVMAAGAAVAQPPPTFRPGQSGIAPVATPMVCVNPITGAGESCSTPLSTTTTGGVRAFRQTTTTSAVALPSNTLTNGVVVKALSTNAGTVYVGPSGVTTATGYPLAAGEAISYGVANSNQLFIIGSDASQVVAVTGN